VHAGTRRSYVGIRLMSSLSVVRTTSSLEASGGGRTRLQPAGPDKPGGISHQSRKREMFIHHSPVPSVAASVARESPSLSTIPRRPPSGPTARSKFSSPITQGLQEVTGPLSARQRQGQERARGCKLLQPARGQTLAKAADGKVYADEYRFIARYHEGYSEWQPRRS
jgi:hypothetical protein